MFPTPINIHPSSDISPEALPLIDLFTMNNSHSSLPQLALPDPRTMAVTASIVYSDELGRGSES